jgi:thiamine biosynthesis lipoprotein
MSYEYDLRFHSMGSDVRILIGPPLARNLAAPSEAARREETWIEDFAARLSRFRADSELSALNRDPRDRVPCSPLLRAAVRAALWAAWRSSGLVDPTLVTAIERAGYERSLDGCEPAPLTRALETAPPRRSARPDPAERWRQVCVDERRGVVDRPPGLQIDTGGTGKGLCADAVAHRLAPYTRYVVDCGGDLAIGGVGSQLDPFEVEIEHPLSGETIRTVLVGTGGVASSGLNVRVWQDEHGRFAHHLLDPSTGRPAWTGVVGATALAPSALEAETLAKTALLLGPAGAAAVLQEHGGLVVRDDGEVEEHGPLGTARGALVASRGHTA